MSSVRLPKESTPQRWQDALMRAYESGVIVRQVNSTGQWVSTSTEEDAEFAYVIDVVGLYAFRCSCPSGEHDDPVCKHRAAFYAKFDLLKIADDGEEPVFSPEPLMYPPLPETLFAIHAQGMMEPYGMDTSQQRD